MRVKVCWYLVSLGIVAMLVLMGISAVSGQSGGAWTDPDSASGWTDSDNAIDGNTGTYATVSMGLGLGSTPWLEVEFTTAVEATHIRFYVTRSHSDIEVADGDVEKKVDGWWTAVSHSEAWWRRSWMQAR